MFRFRQVIFGLPVLLGFAGGATTVSGAGLEQTSITPASINTRLNTLHNSQQVPDGRFGYIIIDAHTGNVLSARNEDDLFIPASLSKIPTTVAVLGTVGANQQFETKLIADGAIVSGVLEGDLHLVGGGDPSLTSRELWKLANGLAGAGVNRITGRFTFYDAALPRTLAIDGKQPAGALYNPGVSGLNIDYNLRTAQGRRFPVAQPGLLAAKMLRKMASIRGVFLPAPLRARHEPFGTEIALHRSQPVSVIAKRMMDKSTNLTAEVLGATAASTFGSRPHSLGAAAQATSDWIKSQIGPISGVGWAGFQMENHSGLGTRSRATPRQMAEILRFGYQRFGDLFVRLHRNDSPGGRNALSLRAKVGSMRFVRGYGGFLKVGGRDMIFTIMSNDDHHRNAADNGQTSLPSAAWMRKAREFEKALLIEWITAFWPRTADL